MRRALIVILGYLLALLAGGLYVWAWPEVERHVSHGGPRTKSGPGKKPGRGGKPDD